MSDAPYTPPPPAKVEAASARESGAAGSEASSWRPGTSGVVGPSDAPSPQEHDLVFINALSSAGLLDDLRAEELARLSAELGDVRGSARRLSFLERYYEAGGDASLAERRRLTDRFFLHKATDEVSAHSLVGRLAQLCPELADIRLERIGDVTDGALVLHCGEHFAGIVDDYELEMDTDEIDLRALDEETKTTSVRGLVGALNRLLGLHGVARRLMALRADVYREAYLALYKADAMALLEAGLLEDESEADLNEHASW